MMNAIKSIQLGLLTNKKNLDNKTNALDCN